MSSQHCRDLHVCYNRATCLKLQLMMHFSWVDDWDSRNARQNLVPKASSLPKTSGYGKLQVSGLLSSCSGSQAYAVKELYSVQSHCGRHCWASWACRGSSLNCEAHGKACEIKCADDSYFIFRTDKFNSENRLFKFKDKKHVCSNGLLLSSPYLT